MLPGMLSGWMKDMLGYRTFFIIVMFLCLITFAVTAFIKVDPEFGKKHQD
jgi:PAT family beta-lactamase induction signal transducer AmpG